MFRWYRRSAVCYVYLEDVATVTLDACTKSESAFRNARWFTRGWTLQELIAPPNVSFFSSNWTLIAYGIFPSDHESDTSWSSGKPPLLPLIMPRRMHRSSHQGPDSGILRRDKMDIYAAVVVFKKKGSKPPQFVAIFLSNVAQEDKGRVAFEPRGKVIPNWSPTEDADLEAVDFSTFHDTEFDGDTLVTVQKIASNPRRRAKDRFVGLTQIIFDRERMMEELRLQPDREDKASKGVLQYYGQDSSDEEADN